jgi:hypothetical protein
LTRRGVVPLRCVNGLLCGTEPERAIGSVVSHAGISVVDLDDAFGATASADVVASRLKLIGPLFPLTLNRPRATAIPADVFVRARGRNHHETD